MYKIILTISIFLVFTVNLCVADEGISKIQEQNKAVIEEASPREQAEQWLSQFNQYWLGSNVENGGSNARNTLFLAIGQMPGPEAWLDINQLIQQEIKNADPKTTGVKQYVLQMIAATLNNDLQTAIALTEEHLQNTPSDNYFYSSLQEYLYELYEFSVDPDLVMKSLNRQLQINEDISFADRVWNYISNKFFSLVFGIPAIEVDDSAIELPEIISLLGEVNAKQWVAKALKQEEVILKTESSRVLTLLRNVALELGDEAAQPQWHLINEISSQSIVLFESIESNFANKGDSKAKFVAEAHYVFSLVVEGNIDKAASRVEKGFALSNIDNGVYQSLIKAGKAEQAYQFLQKYISIKSSSDLIQAYIDVGVAAGQYDSVIANLKRLKSDTSISGKNKSWLEIAYIETLYAVGNDEKATKLLTETATALEKDNTFMQDYSLTLFDLAVKLMQAGRLKNDAALYETAKGIAATLLDIDKETQNNSADNDLLSGYKYRRGIDEIDFIHQLTINGELQEAKQRLVDLSQQQAKEAIGYRGYRSDFFAAELLQIHALMGDYQAAIDMLDQHADWNGATDVSNLIDERLKNKERLGQVIANIFIQTGKKEQALASVRQLLYKVPGYDPAYETYLSLQGPEKAIIEFEKVFTYDAFEERPLIWIAQAYIDLKQYDKAMEYLEKAISIDPSDGEQGKNRRMRVYQLMGVIHKQQNEPEKAQQFNDIVASIRISEVADEYFEAGLTKKSLDMYEEALDYFSDAYCIQSRLAVRQAAFGMDESALSHYQRAYELMPDSFGRMETHCLGCSSVFDRKDAQNLAEKIFTELMASRPEKAQTFYMMGYLQKIRKDYSAANSFYAQAATIDPDYINAWIQLEKMQDELLTAPEEYDDIVINLIRLDPLDRHTSIYEHHVNDVSRFWTDLKETQGLALPKIGKIYPLKTIKKSSKDPNEWYRWSHGYLPDYQDDNITSKTPSELLSSHKTFAVLSMSRETWR